MNAIRCYNSFSHKAPRCNSEEWILSTGLYTNELEVRRMKLSPTSLAVTKGILVSFYCCAALTDMFKFSAYPRSSWCALVIYKRKKFLPRWMSKINTRCKNYNILGVNKKLLTLPKKFLHVKMIGASKNTFYFLREILAVKKCFPMYILA